MTTEEARPDIPSAADLFRLLDWTLMEALTLRHASVTTIRERRRIVAILREQLQRLQRGWKRLSWRFEPDLSASIGVLIGALPHYLEESDQVLAAAELSGAFPDTERWRALYEALSAELDHFREAAAQDRRLSRELDRKKEDEVWPLVGFENQAAYEEVVSPSFATLSQKATNDELRLLNVLLSASTVNESELRAEGFSTEIIVDTISALSRSNLIQLTEENTFTLTEEGRSVLRTFTGEQGNT